MKHPLNFFTLPLTESNLAVYTKSLNKKRNRSAVFNTSPNLEENPFTMGTPSSETTTDSEIGECIYINKDQLLQMVDSERKEVEDPLTKKRFFVATGGELFYNKHNWHALSMKTSIELAVCAGNMYALLMGEKQPEYLVGQNEVDADFDDIEPTYYRVSSKIEFQAEEADMFDLNKPIKGLIFSLLISYFLGDPDVSNVVGVAENDVIFVIRLDPEFCFSRYFTEALHNNYDSVRKEINFIFNLGKGIQALTAKELLNLAERNGIEFFKECFTKRFLKHPVFLKILNSETRIHELLDALKKITETPFSQYEKIIDKSISDNSVRMQLKNTLNQRCMMFLKIYQELCNVTQSTKEISFEGSYSCHR